MSRPTMKIPSQKNPFFQSRCTVAGKGRKFIRFGRSRSEIDGGRERRRRRTMTTRRLPTEAVAAAADASEDVEKEEHELVQALGVGCFATGARPGDWRVGDVILLKRDVLQPGVVEPSRPAASTRKDGYEEASNTDEWFRVFLRGPDRTQSSKADEVVIPVA